MCMCMCAFLISSVTLPDRLHCTDLVSLKHVLAVIADIRQTKMDIELEFVDVQEVCG